MATDAQSRLDVAEATLRSDLEQPAGDDVTLRQDLARLLQQAEQRWSQWFVVDPKTFGRGLATRINAIGGAASEVLGQLKAEDVCLCCGCTDADPAAIERFEAEYLSRIPRVLETLRLDPDTTAEIVQQLRIRALTGDGGVGPLLDKYHGRGRLHAWLRATALQMARRYLSRRKSTEEIDEALEAEAGGANPELAFLKRAYRSVFASALRSAVSDLEPRLRLMLAQHILDGVTADALANMHKVHRSTVFRWLHTARTSILEHMRTEVLALVDVSDAEFETLFAAVRSQLDVSVGRYLRADEP